MFPSRTLLLFIIMLACAVATTPASAHPADMYAQNQTITLTPGWLQIEWSILPGPFLADTIWAAADADQDGAISPDEARLWVAPFVSDLSVTIDGQPAHATQPPSIRWPVSVSGLRTGDDAVQVGIQLVWPIALSGKHSLEIHNAHLESNSLNWFSLAASGGLTFVQPSQENGRLSFDLHFPGGSLPATGARPLTTWTSGTPNLPGFTSSISGLATTLANNGASNTATQTAPGDRNSSATSILTGLVRNVQLSPLFLFSAFLLSLALGSLHALTPGHGKALVGAYLVGTRGRTRDAVLLGGIVTVTHTGSVLALGLITLVASHYILPSVIVPWLELISGLLVIAFGLNLLIQRRRDLLKVSRLGHPHEHNHEHGHHHIHEHDHAHPHDHTDEAHLDEQARVTDAKSRSVPLRSLLALGVSGGLVPCPDAIAILLVAVALNRVPFGMLLIVSFSLGLAAVLIGIGIGMVHGARLLSRSDWLARFGSYAPVVSALVVSALGIGLTLNAWNSFKFSTAAGNPVAKSEAIGQPSTIAEVKGATRLLYIAFDSSGRDQLFALPLSADLMEPNGAAVQYTHESNSITGHTVSPDGKTILYTVFEVDGGSSIWAINSDGGSPRLVLDCPQAECNSPAWFPDGSKIAYERLENTPESVTVPRFSIWWLDLQSGKTQPVFQDAAFPSSAPRFSPDGKWLSYISIAVNTLVLYNLEDGRTISVPLGAQSAIPGKWSPNGDALLFGNRAEQGEPPPLHIKVYTLATGDITDLGGTHGETDLSAAWSPDGKWIAIDRNVPGRDAPSGSSNQVWLVQPDGSQAHALLNEPGASYSGLSWSADGRLLLYSRYTLESTGQFTGRFDVLVTDIPTGETKLLAPGGDLGSFLP